MTNTCHLLSTIRTDTSNCTGRALLWGAASVRWNRVILMSQMFADNEFEVSEGMPVGSKLLNGQFLIQARLQKGGFGITYIARDSLERQVVVKECYPADMCIRSGKTVRAVSAEKEAQFAAIKRQFVREARQVAKLIHPNIVSVHQVFEENNTAYMALDQVTGDDLLTILEENPERLTNEFIKSTLRQMLEAIGYTHAHGVLHRDISPDNLLVDAEDQLTLIDFGAAQEHQSKEGNALPSIIAVKDGYSPHEFYTPNAVHDQSSDFYALGATLYHLITGSTPPSSQDRLTAISKGLADPYVPLTSGNWPVDYNILATADRALEILQENRIQTAADWLTQMNALPETKPAELKQPVIDPNLEAKIANLVQTTNTLLTRTEVRPERSAPRKSTACKEKAQAPAQRTVVDIFGNPIDDVSAWQAEQEREARAAEEARLAAEAARAAAAAAAAEPVQEEPSLLSSLISRYIPALKSKPRPQLSSRGDKK